ncbi:helix-turn-helix protein [Kribbella orskensis]|uniref:Helix-turn-helix protein n=1 Tax=Kribbella orskensis TaxID=2512216 RepID=A0ABY2BLA9_9ACTN|nr:MULTISPECIES: helix-turn-helix transcriptional regulator [Kribbella]TCN39356.1 helix-turn-helix protein [Kribbella sp. VKM Ac-2500]TCO22003.1 helix-turn-helix protein [Kribbella orskensis]
MELSAELRDRRKAAGRTIASVAVDAGLSVPYIANLENGRGNPTLSALSRLATALGAHLQVTLEDDPPLSTDATAGTSVDGGSDGTSGRAPGGTSGAASAALLATSPRATKVIATLASSQGRTRRSVERQLLTALEALTPLLPTPPTETDLNRLLDLLLLAD